MDKIEADNVSMSRLYWQHCVVLFCGFLIGIVFAYLFNSIPFEFSSDILRARKLGIVSRTILAGHSKFRDILTYLSVLGFPVICSLSVWLIWARQRRNLLKKLFSDCSEGFGDRSSGWIISLSIIIACYIFLSFNITTLYRPAYTSIVQAWPLLGEDGQFLAWTQSILSGGVYGKDFFCLYGPMMVYPLTWAMKLFGTTVLVERFYTYFLNLTAYGIAIFFLFKTVRFKSTFIIFSLLFIFVSSRTTLSPNTTYLRTMLGLLPILLICLYYEEGKRHNMLIIGAVAGQSLLFSQEAGICSIISLMSFLFIKFITKSNVKGLVRNSSLILAGCIISIAPMMMYFFLKGALTSFISTLYIYPRLVTLGFGALPFPSFKDFLEAPFSINIYFNYWVIFTYVFALIYLVPLLIIGKTDNRSLLKLLILIFGILLFRVALGRPDYYTTYKVATPAILLVFLFIDSAIVQIAMQRFNFIKTGNKIMLAGLITFFCLLLIYSPSIQGSINNRVSEILNIKEKWSIQRIGVDIPDLERGKIFFDTTTAAAITYIHQFLETHTTQGDYVYFFPNEAAYYFLFNRNNPTRYAISYFAITLDQRKELVEELEEKKPEYVIFSKNTWRVDYIEESIQVPEVVNYLNRKYAPFENSGDIMIAKRIRSL